MKKIYSITVAAGIALALSGCTGNNDASVPSLEVKPAASLDVRSVCSIEKNGINSVLDTATTYNAIAKKHGVEYRRLGMTTAQYIDGAKAAVKSGAKKVVLLNKKAKPTKNSVTTEYAAWRGCVFAVSALQLEAQAKLNWRETVPGDGFKY